ncbi:MAG: phosphoglycerate mutase (2,3-diphosphoglycerate-independent) [Deltaproteobacteria bacterium CG11_big_fil_rev_8_21_14_0_20_49_13]|nr:MAG: phosphoglycerate mutase (2,3-diphosphoglycerate-independent) [Deltaproteobacteria bacterium CG11_big_fil_rev_8_21_14_0_20_49_13]
MKPVILMILDGWGYRPDKDGNAIETGNTPNWHKLIKDWPNTLIAASGLAVGLPEGTMGNSEVGHLNLGAGRVVYQEFTRINKAIEDGSFFKNKTLKGVFADLKKSGGAIHLMGLVSDIGVHSHLNHMYSLMDFAVKEGIKNILIHCFTDGRDSPPDSGVNYIKWIEERIAKQEAGGRKQEIRIATVMGRYYAMDRDKRWDRVEKAYNAIVDGAGEHEQSAVKTMEDSYKKGVTDEFILPTVICHSCESGNPANAGKPRLRGDDRVINDGDAVIFFNFRSDRTRELTRAMTDEKFADFKRRMPKLTAFVTMTRYEEDFKLPVVFPPEHLTNILGEVISEKGLSQLRIAETEKYAHVTYFFNGGEEKKFPGEERVLIPSPRDVPTYDQKPEMSAYAVTDELVKRIESDKYDVIVVNYANPDMVGHTGVMEAAVKAVETVDKCVGRVAEAVLKVGGAMMITGDHGNCEEMYDSRHLPQTAHTTDLVPFVLIGKGLEGSKLREKGGALSDIAPTMLRLLKIEQSVDMTGTSLIE